MNSYTLDNGKTRHFTAPLNVQTFDLSAGLPGSLHQTIVKLRQLDIDAVILKNFLSSDEINSILFHLFKAKENQPSQLAESKTYPFSFAAINRQSSTFANDLYHYFVRSKSFRNTFRANYEIDIEQKFTTLLTALNNSQPARILSIDEQASYIPFTFRMIVPEKNHINLHADNLFPQFAPEFYEPLKKVADVHNQISFFTVLQKPEAGGELSIYNVAYDVAKDFNIEQQSIELENGTCLHADNPQELFRQKLDLDEGDLVLFSGGQLYHRIEEVYGNKMRITLGGFLGYSKINNDIYYWS